RFLGSADLFERQGRRPWSTVNFVAAHDGFTANDLVTYSAKRNHANGENNRDGHNHNLSWNCGEEGPTQSAVVTRLRERQKRNLLATVLLAQGTPMLLAGDEIGNTQGGNNNAYCQDNEIAWLPWPDVDGDDLQLLGFVQRLTALRRAHRVFRRSHFLHGRYRSTTGIPDVTWLNEAGEPMRENDWHAAGRRTLGVLLCGAAGPEMVNGPADGIDETFLVLFNAAREERTFQLPALPGTAAWRRVIDTVDAALGSEGGLIATQDSYPLAAHSLAVLMSTREALADTDRIKVSRHPMPFGAEVLPRGGTRFRLWAPDQTEPKVVLGSGIGDETAVLTMERVGAGWFELWTERARIGTRYAFAHDDGSRVADPASRQQDGGPDDRSIVVDPAAYRWRETAWGGRPWHEAVIMELHVGSFSPEGTFEGVARRLVSLAEVGVTAIQLMPVGCFSGRWGWGYDAPLPFAPAPPYGSPESLKALVDAAHAQGIMVFLDLVYTREDLGDGDDSAQVGIEEPVESALGGGLDFRQRPVRDFVIHNALYWLEEYRMDGLRLVVAPHLVAAGAPDVLDELAAIVAERFGSQRHVHLMLEHAETAIDRLEGPFRAQWNDDFHHALHATLTGESDGPIAAFAVDPIERLGQALAAGLPGRAAPPAAEDAPPTGIKPKLPSTRTVVFSQNHDQIGNRPDGARLTRLVERPAVCAAQALVVLSPQVPMLFMGEEWATQRPFHFFTDLPPDQADVVRRGRRRMLETFRQNVDQEQVDPNAVETFAAGRLDWNERETETGRRHRIWFQELIQVRHRTIVPLLQEAPAAFGAFQRVGAFGLVVRWPLARGSILSLHAQLGALPGRGFPVPDGEPLWVSSREVETHWPKGTLPPWGVASFLSVENGA
ncbi:MAG: alpha-amylase family glycosyl hydrolase, partial [Pseudomonadota bacterium]